MKLRKGYEEAAKKLLSRVQATEEGCWEWTGTKISDGYGHVSYKGKLLLAHRLAYTAYVGDIPEGKLVLHKCDNPACFYPKHLEVGTQFDNMRDMMRKGRGTHGERSAKAKLTEKDVLEILDSNESNYKLAYKYDVGVTCVGDIRRGRTWKHLKESK